MISILITDDHPVVRRGIRQILEDEANIGLIDEAGNGIELLSKLNENTYNVILLDISMPGTSGLDLISDIKKVQPSAGILMLSIYSEDVYAVKALKYGASGYLIKTSAPEELLTDIFKVSKGERYISASLAEKIADAIGSDTVRPMRKILSTREIEVLGLFAKGRTVAQIASELSLSPKTVSTYRERLISKLKLKTTADLIRYALLEGIPNP